MDQSLAANLLAYSAQVACIAAAGCALPALFRLDVPSVRFVYWRALVLLCLALPLIQRKVAIDSAGAASADTSSAILAIGAAGTADGAFLSNPAVHWPQLLGLLLAAGFVGRLLWIAAGLLYLRRLRSAGTAAHDDATTRELQAALGTRADVRIVPGLTQPVTFGVLRPVVLLPDRLREHDPEIRRAVVAHELVHVQRRDWAWIVGEELVRAALWFHPAMWWMISRVQLAREEVVDETVVTITGKRRPYVEALLAFADTTPLAPAPAFARRRHLFRRMTLITREAVMSSNRIVVSCAVMGILVAGGGWYAVGAFPMQQGPGDTLPQGPGPLERAAKPITPENPIPRRVQFVQAEYPAEAAALQASGSIALRVTLDATGRVAEARRVSGTVRTGNPAVTVTFTDSSFNGQPRVLLRDGTTDTKPEGAGLTSSRAVFDAIDVLTRPAIAAVRQWAYEPPADAPISFGITVRFLPDGQTTSAQAMAVGGAAATAGPTPPQWTADGALRVGGGVKPPTRIHDVKPVYPQEARDAGIQGVVIIEARIEPDGSVSNTRVLRSVQGLDQAALDAVSQWRFVPTLLNSQAVPVIMTVTVNFTLQ